MRSMAAQAGSAARRAGWVGAALAAALSCQTALAGYRAGPGDVFDISVLAVPELQRRVPVEPDGTISFPLIGNITVQGLTLPELRARIKAALGGRVVTLRGANDAQTTVAIDINDVLVSVATYRPIFVRGEVVKPGEYAYRGPIAVREAVAMSGGYLAASASGEYNLLRSMDLRGELETLWLDFAKERARLWRVTAEIGDKVEDRDAVARSVPLNAPIDRSAFSRIVELAAEHLEARRANHKGEREALEALIKQLTEEIGVRDAQVAQDEKAYNEEVEEFGRLTALKEKGVVTPQRYAEARRDLVASSTRMLLGSTRLNDAKRERTERQLQLHKLHAEWMHALYRELEEATARLGEIRAKLRSASEKLNVVGGRGILLGDPGSRQPVFVVHRRTAQGIERLPANEDFELVPGDVVDVALVGSQDDRPTR
jgi:polysaccharide export outer membrane protein